MLLDLWASVNKLFTTVEKLLADPKTPITSTEDAYTYMEIRRHNIRFFMKNVLVMEHLQWNTSQLILKIG